MLPGAVCGDWQWQAMDSRGRPGLAHALVRTCLDAGYRCQEPWKNWRCRGGRECAQQSEAPAQSGQNPGRDPGCYVRLRLLSCPLAALVPSVPVSCSPLGLWGVSSPSPSPGTNLHRHFKMSSSLLFLNLYFAISRRL